MADKMDSDQCRNCRKRFFRLCLTFQHGKQQVRNQSHPPLFIPVCDFMQTKRMIRFSSFLCRILQMDVLFFHDAGPLTGWILRKNTFRDLLCRIRMYIGQHVDFQAAFLRPSSFRLRPTPFSMSENRLIVVESKA